MATVVLAHLLARGLVGTHDLTQVFWVQPMASRALDKRVKRQDSMRQSTANVTQVKVTRTSVPGEACELRRRALCDRDFGLSIQTPTSIRPWMYCCATPITTSENTWTSSSRICGPSSHALDRETLRIKRRQPCSPSGRCATNAWPARSLGLLLTPGVIAVFCLDAPTWSRVSPSLPASLRIIPK